MVYQPIDSYGIIGNMHTAALVGRNGSIDWFCSPNFDSPSVFGALLDDEKGGRFQISPDCDNDTHQSYWPDTNVLITRFLCDDGVGEVIDFMPVPVHKDEPACEVVRRVSVVRGEMAFQLTCQPAFDYARASATLELTDREAVFRSDQLALQLAATVPLESDQRGIACRFRLRAGETAAVAARTVPLQDSASVPPLSMEQAEVWFERTVDYWRSWIRRCTYKGRWREMVYRSALVLKLLTFQPTGAIVAAPTCSLPEEIGGERNWDYRYTWLRDAAFTLYALMRIGQNEEAGHFMQFIQQRCHEGSADHPLQVMYRIDGSHQLEEKSLDHLEGYRGSSPVRIGNAAVHQLQLDIYGELMDAVYLYNKYGTPISYDLWVSLQDVLNWVCENWQREDHGIWEVRGGVRHFVYSKLMSWVALDRGLRLADKRSFPANRDRWLKERDAIYREIMAKGWCAQREAFVQSYGCSHLDASNLLMPLVFFLSPTDPRMLKTIEAVREPPERGGLRDDSLIYRYDLDETPDGLKGREGSFNLCSFWLVEAMTRAGTLHTDMLRKARLHFEQMLSYANHLGLFAEETGRRGEALGNFPLALTHLSLISAAYNLDRVLNEQHMS